MMTLTQAFGWTSHSGSSVRLRGDTNLRIRRVHTDTRSVQPGDLFVALKGDHFDAHDFLAQARAKGAIAAIAQHGLASAGLPGLEVEDSKLALGQLAAGWRSQFSLPLVAVTGSNGKTTVTQMIAAILQAWKQDAAFFTEGNLNNDIGVPLTLLRLNASNQVGVVELGMNHPGEIAGLAKMVCPAVALVNNAQREHLEFMHTVSAVAHENGAVITALGEQGVAVFPADDEFTPVWRALAGSRKTITFAAPDQSGGHADITATSVWADGAWKVQACTPAGALGFTLAVAGRHNVKNALAASACALAVGVPLAAISAGLSAFVPVSGRSCAVTLVAGTRAVTLIDDSYNANPDSMRAAIDVLAGLPGPRLLVMGDMAEVGNDGPAFHREAVACALQAGIDRVFSFGAQFAAVSAEFATLRHFNDLSELQVAVGCEFPGVASVLVKGSRSMKMERVVRSLTAQASADGVGKTQQVIKGATHAA